MFIQLVYAMGQTQQAQGAEAPHPLVSLMPLILMFVVFYFLLIRPQQKKQKDHQKMLTEIKKNDEVVTSGGIHGTIVNIKDKTYSLRVDDNVKIEVSKSVISVVKKKIGVVDGE
ncbi:preprotein translocase subunit YajC [bacterium]|nr:MAG: preprotein translocase subunit YajC [bacterium]